MKLFAAICASLIAVTLTAGAQETKPMTVGEAMQILNGLRSLDGHPVIVKQNGQDVAVMQAWSFKSGALRLAIADNIAALIKLETATDQARVGIVKEIAKDGTQIAPGSKEMEEFTRQYSELLNAPFPGGAALTKIDVKALNLDANEIAVTTLTALSPILSR